MLGRPVPLQHSPGIPLEANTASSLADLGLFFIQRPVDKRELAEGDGYSEAARPTADDGDLQITPVRMVIGSHD